MVHILHVIVVYLQHFCLHELHNFVYTNTFEYLVVEVFFVCTLSLKVLLLNTVLLEIVLTVCC